MNQVEQLLYFFPDLYQRLGNQNIGKQLEFGEWRYDWQSCTPISIPHDTKLCIRLSYDDLTSAVLGNIAPTLVEISWKSTQDDYLKAKIQSMNDAFMNILIASPLYQ